MIPTREECLSLIEKYGMLRNIVDHSLTVSRVALFLSRELNRKGQRIDPALVEAASLLHDIAKTKCLKTKEDHAEVGSRLLTGLGYDRVAGIVAQHIEVSKEIFPSAVSEEEVVNYADKRVLHDRIVSLKERFYDLKDRYGHSQPALDHMDRMEASTFRIEHKIFSILGTSPNILDHVQDDIHR